MTEFRNHFWGGPRNGETLITSTPSAQRIPIYSHGETADSLGYYEKRASRFSDVYVYVWRAAE